MENRLLVLLRDKGTDIHTDDTFTLFTDDRNREIMEKTSVNIMHSVYHDRAKDNRNTTGSGHRLYDGAATKLMLSPLSRSVATTTKGVFSSSNVLALK